MKVWLLACVVLMVCHTGGLAQGDLPADEAYPEEENDSHGETVTGHYLVAPADLQTTRAYQEQDLVVREFDEEKWRSVVAGADYSEEEAGEFKFNDSSGSWDGPLLRLISYILIIGLVLALLYFIWKNISFDLRIRRTITETDDPEKPVVDIESPDIGMLLERAVREGNFRLAVRLYYLSLLRKLNEQGFIVWKKDKTNRDYLNELFSRDFFCDEIRELTLSYESVWYGDHDIRPESFQDLSTRFDTVLGKIDNSKNR